MKRQSDQGSMVIPASTRQQILGMSTNRRFFLITGPSTGAQFLLYFGDNAPSATTGLPIVASGGPTVLRWEEVGSLVEASIWVQNTGTVAATISWITGHDPQV